MADDWSSVTQFSAVCYSDVAVLYKTRAATFPPSHIAITSSSTP
jgi:hypothetical protein